MARVTVEDCVTRVPNRFDLVMLAAQRARNMSAGAQLTIDRDNDKNPVVALREIAEETIELPPLEESLIKGLQRHVEMDEPVEEEEMDMLSAQQDPQPEGGEANPDEEIAEDVLTVQDDAAASDAGGEVMMAAENGDFGG